MRIGIDARPLSRLRTGIGNYLHNILYIISEIDRENEYILFSNEDFNHDVLLKSNFSKQISNDRVGALCIGFKIPILLRKNKIDVFWGTQHMVPLYKISEVKYVTTIHDLALYYYPHVATTYINIINRIFIPRSLQLSSKVIAVSESTKKDILSLFKVVKDKVVVIGEGGNEKFKPLNREDSKRIIAEEYDLNFPYILYVGTIEPRKNLESLIKAFKIFNENYPNYKLVVAGKKGWKYESFFKLLDELNIKDNVILPGYIDDEYIPYLYNACDLFVFPSLYEGFGLPVLEAMQCGINVITSNVSSLPEVLPVSDALINPKDYKQLAYKIKEYISDKEFYNEENINLSKRYSWYEAAVETQKLLTSFKR